MIYIGFESFGIDLGVLLLLISIFALALDAFLIIFGEYVEKWEFYSELSLTIGCSSLLISFIYFTYSTLTADYSFLYVSTYVNNNMDIFMRISAIWSGQAGSLFFWAFLAGIAYIVFRTLFRDYAHEPLFWRSFVLLAIQVAVLSVLTLLNDPFKPNQGSMANGIGLDPVLMTVWNLIHPPIIFVGYVLCLIPMVIAIIRISILEDGKIPNFEGKQKVDAFFEFTVSLAWLILSSGIILGGYWAYITLGWGGFWAWDPVETASLIPWLFLTLYYHGKSFHQKSKFLGNFIISMAYVGVLIATYLTRSGILTSVHAYQVQDIPDINFIMSIILTIIPDEKILLLFLVIVGLFLFPIILGIKNGELKRTRIMLHKTDFQIGKSKSTSLKVSYISFLLGTFFMVFVLLFPVLYDIIGYLVTLSPNKTGFWFVWFGPSVFIDQVVYNTLLAIFGGVMLIAQFFCTFYPRVSLRRKYLLIIGGIIAGIVFAVSGALYRDGTITSIIGEGNPIIMFFSNFWTTSDKANLILPLILLGIIGLAIEFVYVSLKEEKNLVRKTSQIMLHLSLLTLMLGALLSSNMTITQNLSQVREGGQYEISGTSLTISIIDLDRRFPNDGKHSVEFDTAFMIGTGGLSGRISVSQLAYDLVDRPDPGVAILGSLFADIYVVTTGIYTDNIADRFVAVDLQVKIIPYISILWIGCILLHFAVIPLVIGRFILLKGEFTPINEDTLKKEIKEEKISQKEKESMKV